MAESGNCAAAAAKFEAAILLEPGRAALHEMLAQCRMECGEYEAAVAAAAGAVACAPQVGSPTSHLAGTGTLALVNQ